MRRMIREKGPERDKPGDPRAAPKGRIAERSQSATIDGKAVMTATAGGRGKLRAATCGACLTAVASILSAGAGTQQRAWVHTGCAVLSEAAIVALAQHGCCKRTPSIAAQTYAGSPGTTAYSASSRQNKPMATRRIYRDRKPNRVCLQGSFAEPRYRGRP